MADLNLIAKAYAKSIIGLSENTKTDLVKELIDFNSLISASNELENLIFIDVFSQEEKLAVIEEIMNRNKNSDLFKNFIRFLVQEKRLGIITLVFKEVVVLDDDRKGFLKGVIQGHSEKLDQDVREKFEKYLTEKTGKKIKFDYFKNESIVAGYRILVGDLQLDATLDRQLENFKQSATN
jgi:F-type H+-transporting ATPase subunit delta